MCDVDGEARHALVMAGRTLLGAALLGLCACTAPPSTAPADPITDDYIARCLDESWAQIRARGAACVRDVW